jgi:tRNA(Ile)-lysidine synthase
MKVWDIFYKNIFRNSFVTHGDRVILAVSGGVDSVCMLHLFWRLKKKINFDLLIVNFDHDLRKESIKESKTVRELSFKFNLNCLVKKINVTKYSKRHSISVETAGRRLRYLILEGIAEKYEYNKIATAHNANDNAETVLLWLLRGSGSFAGIPQKRRLNENIVVIRPLLPIRREFIEEYVGIHNLTFCIDESNFSDVYTRNKIRMYIVPVFEKINPMVVEHIFNLSCIQARENKYLEEISNNFIKKYVKIQKNKILLDLTVFLQYNEAVQFRIIKNILPEKKYSSCINLIMCKILLSDVFVLRISDSWIFEIKSNKAYFTRDIKNENL